MEIRGEYRIWDRVRVCGSVARMNPVAVISGLPILLLSLWVGIHAIGPDGRADTLGWACLALALTIAMVFVHALWRRWRNSALCRRGWRGEHVFRTSVAGLTVGARAGGTQNLVWACFNHWHEAAGCFLLIMPDGQYECIPRRFFATPTDQVAFRRMLHECIDIRPVLLGTRCGWLGTVLALGELLVGASDDY